MTFIAFILWAVAFYLLCGLVFAVPFIIKGVQEIDEGAFGSKWNFRIIILPGVVVFWPWLFKRWLGVKKGFYD